MHEVERKVFLSASATTLRHQTHPRRQPAPWASVSAAAVLLVTIMSSAALHANDEHLGLIEYEIACMPCHGPDGKGRGSLASDLVPPPSDLTGIARANGGTFPFQRIEGMIDGRKQVAAHGARAMPVWGARYRITAEQGESRETVETRARRRIRALVRFVESLQSK
ncbi:MAG: c-type cytochrome [Hyphomicrobiaceae bacterium]